MRFTLKDLPQVVRDFLATLPKDAAQHAYVVGISGELGSGKTAFVQELARQLGVVEVVTSPTYVIQSSYVLEDSPFLKLVHVDAYRITKEESGTIDWEKTLGEPRSLVVVEWPEMLGTAFPQGAHKIKLTVINDTEREITYEA